MKKSITSIFLMIILGASFIGVFFVMSIMDLVNKKDLHTASITEAYELLTVENSISGLIPTGRDYYYLGLNEENQKMYIIHGDKNWLANHFDADGAAANANGISITALVKRAGDYDVEKELEKRLAQVDGYDSALDFGRVLELHYVRDAILKILAGILLSAIIGIWFFVKKSQKEYSLAARRIFLGVFVFSLLFALVTIL